MVKTRPNSSKQWLWPLQGHLYFNQLYWRGSSPFDLSVAFPPSRQLQHSSFCWRPFSLNHPLFSHRLLFHLKNTTGTKQKLNTSPCLLLIPSFKHPLLSLFPFTATLPEIDVQIHSLWVFRSFSLSKPPLPPPHRYRSQPGHSLTSMFATSFEPFWVLILLWHHWPLCPLFGCF